MLTNTDYRAIADGNGSTVDFTFGFPIISATDLKVYKVTKATGALGTLLTLNVDYTVTINTVTEGGTVTYAVAPTALQQSLIYRDVPYTQPEQFPSEGNYPEERIERMGDRAAMLINQLKGALTRAILLPITSALTNLTLPTPSAGKAIKWNSTEDGFENSTYDPDTAVASAESARDAAIVAQTAAELAETNAETAEANAEAAQAAAEAAAAAIPAKASQAEAEAGVVDNAYMTPLKTKQAVTAQVVLPVKATGAEIDTGTDDAKFATPKAIADSSLGKFGTPASKSIDTVYQADTDGLVYGSASVVTNSAEGFLFGYTDANNPPTTNVSAVMIFRGATDHQACIVGNICFAVKKGNYYKASIVNKYPGTPSFNSNIFFTPKS